MIEKWTSWAGPHHYTEISGGVTVAMPYHLPLSKGMMGLPDQ